MAVWIGGLEWIVGQLVSFFAFLLPVLATFGAVFLGVYLNGVIDRERKREVEVFRPLLDETSSVMDASSKGPINTLLEKQERRSVLLDIDQMELYAIDEETREDIMTYLDAVQELAGLDDVILSTTELLHESGYGEFLGEQLPNKMLMESDEGIESERWASVPGPHIVAGRRTVVSGQNPVLPSNSTRVSGDYRRPLLPILVEHASVLRGADSSADLRDVFESRTDVDVSYLDERCPNWAEVLWEVLQEPWEGEPIDFDDGPIGMKRIPADQHHNMVEGDDFHQVFSSAGYALQFRRIEHRKRVIERAEQLHKRLFFRVSQPLYHPKRILIARH